MSFRIRAGIGDMTRNVVLYQLLSLDGVAEEPGDWIFDGGDEMFANLARTIETQDEILLGRGTYDYWVGYRPTSTIEPFASFINRTRKHVFTSSEPSEGWANTTFVSTSAVRLRREAEGAAGPRHRHPRQHRARGLAPEARLVDELRLVVAPSLAGKGRELFADDDVLDTLELLDVARSPKGTLFLHYRRVA